MDETVVAGQAVPIEPADQQATEPEPVEGEAAPDQWMLMVDPEWQPSSEGEAPPEEVVVGGWFVDDDGNVAPFLGNPGYRPTDPDAPTDPVDAALQLVLRGEAEGDQLLSALGEVVLSIAVDDDGIPIVAPAPDDMPSVLVTTAPLHRVHVEVSGWVDLTIADLVEALPEEGVDVLLNPGAARSIRLLASALLEHEW